jgi:pimeloyl-ACP methyl ester carboxylesterase
VNFVERLASFARVVLFDKRGMGLSDRLREVPTLETRMDDVRVVMDASGSEQAALFAAHEGARLALLPPPTRSEPSGWSSMTRPRAAAGGPITLGSKRRRVAAVAS